MANDLITNLDRDLFVLEKEHSPSTSRIELIFPRTTLDQVFDQKSPTRKTLRQILEDLRFDVKTIGLGKLKFPVRSVNGLKGDVIITPASLNLARVDNTADVDKPLSTPQRAAIMDILSKYNFKLDLAPLYEHISNTNNPHNVTVQQLDEDNKLHDYVEAMINSHSLDERKSVHLDIRNSLAQLWNYVDEIFNLNFEKKLLYLNKALNNHYIDPKAHKELFDEKEDKVNKVFEINDHSVHSTYPSSLAVSLYIKSLIEDYELKHPPITEFVSKVEVIDTKNQLPTPSELTKHIVYVIKNGDQFNNEIATCYIDGDGLYHWRINDFGANRKFDKRYFIETADGISLNVPQIYASDEQIDALFRHKIEDLLSAQHHGSGISIKSIVEDTLNTEYMKRDEMERTYLKSVKILPGTKDAHIQYYVNNDVDHAVEVKIPGFKKLAFMDKVCEREILEQSIENRHLRSNSVDGRVIEKHCIKREHLSDKILTADMFPLPKQTVMGNPSPEDGKCTDIDMIQLAHMLEPFFDPHMEASNRIRFNADHFFESEHGLSLNLKSLATILVDAATMIASHDVPPVNGTFIPNSDPTSIQHMLTHVDKSIVATLMKNSSYRSWEYNKETVMFDGTIGIKFKGTISTLPNSPHRVILSSEITSDEYELIEIGGRWVTDSERKAETIIGGSNILGNTQSEFELDTHGLVLHTISIGNRIDAPFDVWARLMKK